MKKLILSLALLMSSQCFALAGSALNPFAFMMIAPAATTMWFYGNSIGFDELGSAGFALGAAPQGVQVEMRPFIQELVAKGALTSDQARQAFKEIKAAFAEMRNDPQFDHKMFQAEDHGEMALHAYGLSDLSAKIVMKAAGFPVEGL